jgi:hypothetical protein
MLTVIWNEDRVVSVCLLMEMDWLALKDDEGNLR